MVIIITKLGLASVMFLNKVDWITSHDVYMGVYNKVFGVFKTSLITLKKFTPQ